MTFGASGLMIGATALQQHVMAVGAEGLARETLVRSR